MAVSFFLLALFAGLLLSAFGGPWYAGVLYSAALMYGFQYYGGKWIDKRFEQWK